MAAVPTMGNPYTYTGREYDTETGLYFYRARYFDPSIGRFISEDPIGFGGGINFYGYVGGNSLNFIDPFGYQLMAPGIPVGYPTTLGGPLTTGPLDTGNIDVGPITLDPLRSLGQDQAQKQREYEEYKRRCREQPPAGLDPCAKARWKLKRNKDCKRLREAWDRKWDGNHAIEIRNLERAIKKLEKWIKNNCKPC